MESETEIENRAPENGAAMPGETPLIATEKDTPTKGEEGGDASSKEGTPYRHSSLVNMRKMQKMFQNAAEENIRSIRAYVTELKERVAKLQYQKQLLVCQVNFISSLYPFRSYFGNLISFPFETRDLPCSLQFCASFACVMPASILCSAARKQVYEAI